MLLSTAELVDSNRWNLPLQAFPSRSRRYLYSFASFHPNALWKSKSFFTAPQLPSSTSHCPSCPVNAKSTYLFISADMLTFRSTRLSTPLGVSTPSPENLARRYPVLSFPMNHSRTR